MAKKKWVSFLFRVFITLLLFMFLFKSLSWSVLFAALAHVRYAFLMLGLLIGVVGSLTSAYQWQSLLRAEQIQVGLVRLFRLYLIGIGFSHFLPTGMGGDVVKAYYVGRASGNYAGSASAVVMTRLTGYFGMQVVAISTLLIFHTFFASSIVIWAILFSLLVGSMIGGVMLLTTLLPKIFKGALVKPRIFASAIPVGEALIAAIRRPRLLGSATAVGVVFWVQSVLDYYAYAYALHMSVPLYFYFVAIPVVSLVAFLPITINGFGLRESAFVSLFATVHVPMETSLLLALLMDAQVLFFGMIGGCLYLAMNGEGRMRDQRHETEDNDGRAAIAEGGAAVMWFTEEGRVVYDAATLEFDDSTPTLPMMLLRARPESALRERAGSGAQASTRWQNRQQFAAALTPLLQETRPKAIFGKNKRVILIKDEDKHEENKMLATASAGLSRQMEHSYEVYDGRSQ